MSFFKADKEQAAKQEGGNYITASGIYDVEIKHVIVDENEQGGIALNFNFDMNGQNQTLWGGMRLMNNNGTENFQAETFNKLLVILDLEEIADPEEATLPIGKDGADKDVMVLPDIEDVALKMRVQMEYGKYNGNYTEKKVIKAFYREDGASADEIINETEVGVKLAKDEAYASNITYKESKKGAGDAPTAEEIAEWIAAKRPKGTAGEGSTSSAPAANKPKFGNKFKK